MSLILITPPEVLPVTLVEARYQLQIEQDDTSHDVNLTRMIGAATQRVEDLECWIQLVTATYELRLDFFPSCGPIIIPRPPLQSVESITYIDADGAEQTFGSSPLTEYVVDTKSIHTPVRGEVRLAYGQSWPSIRRESGAVRVRFTCGFPDQESPAEPAVPAAIKQWILLQVGAMFANREAELVGAGQAVSLAYVDHLLDPYRARQLS